MDDALTSKTVKVDDSGIPGGKGCRSFLRKINAEPVILFSTMGSGMIGTVMPLFLYWARCVQIFDNQPNISYNSTITDFCQQLTKQNSTYQNSVERDISTWRIYLQLGSGLPTLIIAPILGAWADGAGGRKKPLIISFLGLTVNSGLQIAATLTYKTIPVYPLLFLAELAAGLTGGTMTLFATSFAMVSDATRDQMQQGDSNVSVRMGIASALQMLGGIIGGIVASLFVRFLPREQSYIMGAVAGGSLIIITAVYAVFYIQETHSKTKERKENISNDHPSSSFCSTFWRSAKTEGLNLIQVLIEKREGWTRFCLNMSLLFLCVETFSFDGSLLLLLFKKPPFDWSDTTWTNYSIFKGLTFTIGMIVFPALIARTNWLGKDSILIMSGTFVAAVISIMVSFAQTTELLFICAGIGFFTGGITPGFRSFIPRMVRQHETARLLTAFGVVGAVVPIISAIVFNSIFNATLTFWPAFVYFLVGIVIFAVLFGQCIVHMLMRRLWLQQMRVGVESVDVSGHIDSHLRDTHDKQIN